MLPRYEAVTSFTKQSVVKQISEIDHILSESFGEESIVFEEALTDINNERKLNRLKVLFDKILNQDLQDSR